MAPNAIRGRGKRIMAPAAPAPLSIGEVEGELFNCPTCARPLATGARRCPGCGTYLVIGVPIAKASLFASIGLAVGLVAGTGLGWVALSGSSAAVPPTESAAPSASALAGMPTAVATPSGVPALARSALGQAADLHVRLTTARDELEPLVGASRIDSSAVAGVLRAIAADAAYGANLPGRIASWGPAARLSAELAGYYAQLRQTASDGLRHSIVERSAYRDAGVTMVALLGDLPALDEQTRAIATDAGANLPPAYGP